MNAQKFLLLRADIDRTLTQIAAVVAEGRGTLERLDGSPTTLELRGIGSILHDFYTGIEQLLEHIASELDGEIPVGADWHAQLLGRMTSVIESVRPAVLSPDLADALRPYLRFHHLFRNIYGAQLRWELCRGLATEMGDVWEKFHGEMEAFKDVLKSLHAGCS